VGLSTTIGIVGQGFVGTAIREGFKSFVSVETYDKYKSDLSTCASLEDLSEKAEIIFICLPTPMSRDGSCNISTVCDTIMDLDRYSNDNIVVIKSTVPPGTTRELNLGCKNVQVVFSPEFLTEANFINDFKNQTRIIIGGPRPASTKVKNLFRKVFQETPLVKTGSDTAEMVKYFTNCFLATKVSFSNEIKQVCEKISVDYDKVVEYALYDGRLGRSHFSVPGPDGRLGFGGSCFPKDLNALIKYAEGLQISPKVLQSVWEKNLEVRPEKDWEMLKGRAVTEESSDG
jgi:nucleotide sugar dehydrogenase